MPRLHRTAPVVLTPLLGIALVACGGGPSPGDEVDVEEFAQRISDAAEESSSAQVRMELISSGLVTTSDGQVDYTGEEPAMTMSMQAPALGDRAIESRLLEGTMYLAVPDRQGETGIWYRVDLDDPNNPMAGNLGPEAIDPRATIDSFGEGLQKVVYVGDDQIEGIDTEHYEVTGETSSVTGGEDTPELPETLTYDVWLDDEDRMVQMEADLDDQGSMTLTMTKWGEAVEVEAPPSDQVRDYPTGKSGPGQPGKKQR